jgi:hypothetical protein
MSRRLTTPSRLGVTAALAALVAIGPGWSTSAWTSTLTAQQTLHAATASKHVSLSGKWSGTYGGAFSGTFKLTWQQTGHNLSGTIKVSGFKNVPTSIHGTVRGDSIRFGTVGSQSITYSGSVSGPSMSGDWKILAGGKSMGGGSWSASKSS